MQKLETPTVVWQIRVSLELDERVTEAARRMGVNKQELIRITLAQYFDNLQVAQRAIGEAVRDVGNQALRG